MNPKTKKKILIDIVMTAIFLFLMNLSLTGVLLHEWLGVGIVGLFIAHLAINAQWIKNVTMKFFQPIGAKAKAMYILNVLLALSMALTLISGVLISQYLFAPLAAANFTLWYGIHKISSWATLAIVVSHTLVHWNWIRNVIRQFVKSPSLQPVRQVAVRLIVGLFALGAIYSLAVGPALDLLSTGQTSADKQTTLVLTQSTSISSVAAGTETTTTIVEPLTTSDEATAVSDTTTTEATPTLAEFLSNFTCTACGKHCLLSNPRCAKGIRQAATYETQYNETYAVIEG